MINLKLEIGDVMFTTDNYKVRIASQSNANKFVSLEQANELLALVAVDIEGEEVFVTPAEAIEHRANTEVF